MYWSVIDGVWIVSVKNNAHGIRQDRALTHSPKRRCNWNGCTHETPGPILDRMAPVLYILCLHWLHAPVAPLATSARQHNDTSQVALAAAVLVTNDPIASEC